MLVGGPSTVYPAAIVPLDVAEQQKTAAESVRAVTPTANGDRAALNADANAKGSLGPEALKGLVLSALEDDGPGSSARGNRSSDEASGSTGSDDLTTDTAATTQADDEVAEGDDRGPSGLTPDEEAVVRDMQARDAEVRRHEQAHAIVGGQYAGQPSYTYQTGPDDKRYAVAGEVAIDVSPVPDDPEATIQKMEQVKAAALAPAEPSGQDRKVAALADSIRQQAVAELRDLRSQPVAEEAEQGFDAARNALTPREPSKIDEAA